MHNQQVPQITLDELHTIRSTPEEFLGRPIARVELYDNDTDEATLLFAVSGSEGDQFLNELQELIDRYRI